MGAKIISSLILLINIGIINATDYYFSNNGSDGNAGTNQNSPWQTVSKMQQTINSLNPGDRILLERGSVWYEVALTINNINGNASNPIRFEAYGEGEMPVLSGGKLVTDFSNSGNIYSAEVESSFPRGPILVPAGILIDGNAPDIARSEEYFTQGTNSWTQLIDESQSWTTNELVGSIMIYQPVFWSWCASPITSNTATTANFYKAKYILSNNKWTAYYIANNDKYLESDGDWTFKNNTLKVYSATNLNDKVVQFSVSDSIIGVNNSSNLVFSGISFELANYRLLSFIRGSNITIDDCKFGFSGGTGIKFYRTSQLSFTNSYVHNMGAMGIITDQCNTPIIRYNLFKHITSNKIGLGNYVFRYGAAVSNLTPSGDNSYIEYNYFDSVGLAIQSHTFLPGRTCSYSYNYIQNHGVNISDCAAIYAASDWDATNKTIKNNIIKGAITSGYRYTSYGNYATNPHPALHPHAIYIDEGGYAYKCDSNSIEDAAFAFYTNRSHSSSFRYSNVINGNLHNTSKYNAVYMKDQVIGPITFSADRDEVKYNNIVFDDNPNPAVYLRHTSSYNSGAPDNNYFEFDYNKIASPFLSTTYVGKYVYEWGAIVNNYSLSQMRNNSDNVNSNSSDQNTLINPQSVMYSEVSGSVSEEDFVKMFINYSSNRRTVDLGDATFKDMDGNDVSGSITVPPFYSKILFYISGNLSTVDSEVYIDSTLIPAFSYVNDVGRGEISNHRPTINDDEFVVAEQPVVPLQIGALSVDDPDEGQTLSYSIISGNSSGLFEVTTDGILNFTTQTVDFSGNPEYELVIQVTDNGTPVLSDQATITISLVAVADGPINDDNNPPIINPQSFNTSFDADLPALVGVIDASDPDNGQNLSYAIISGNYNNMFHLNSETGELYMVQYPAGHQSVSFILVVEVTDNADISLSAEANITVFVAASEFVYFIDPENLGDELADGSYEHPFSSWNDVEWVDGGSYLQKRGTIAGESKILILANDVTLGDYGNGTAPKINSTATDYAIKAIDKKNVTIKNIEIEAEGAIGCVYFIGSSCQNNALENCKLLGADYGLRIIDGDSYIVKYNVFNNDVNGIYSIADYAEIYYNVFSGNHVAINLSSYSTNAKIYNNVFYDNTQGVSTSYAEVVLFNNIFYLTQANHKAINHKLDKLVSDHNIFYPEQQGFIVIEDVEYNSLEEYQNDYGLDIHSFSGDPLFVDIYNSNFTVTPTSGAIDAGKTVGLTQDFYGENVPKGGAPDIGLSESDYQAVLNDNVLDLEETDFSVYPNPSSGRFNLGFNNKLGTMTDLFISSLSGAIIYRQQYYTEGILITEIDITDYSPGMYILSIRANDKLYTRKIITK
ncbi:MAG: cadherin domain-containing protein [Bacteroidales bacterium]|nr:cadherin domain-containing protein [Bacteroidales bacterium]